ncbi:MAG: hypothetical protein ACRDL7_13530, partial [Gaiellaceae bacterium]
MADKTPEFQERIMLSQTARSIALAEESLVTLLVSALLTGAALSGCGGDGSGPSRPSAPPPPGATMFRGNLARMTAQPALRSLQLPKFA